MAKLLLFLLGGLISWPLSAQVQLVFQGNPGKPVNLTYSLTAVVESQTLADIRHRGPGTDWFMTLDSGLHSGGNPLGRKAASPTGKMLDYRILRGDGTVFTPVQGVAGTFPTKTGGGWNNAGANFTIQLVPDQFPEAGTYTDSIQVLLYQGTDSTGILKDSATMTLTVTMAQVVDMRITPPGQGYSAGTVNFTLDHSTLIGGEVRQADLLVRTNVPFSVEVASQNGGSLRNTVTGFLVPYLFKFQGGILTFSGTAPVAAVSAQPPSGPVGSVFSLETVTDAQGALPDSGSYQDILTFTVVPN